MGGIMGVLDWIEANRDLLLCYDVLLFMIAATIAHLEAEKTSR